MAEIQLTDEDRKFMLDYISRPQDQRKSETTNEFLRILEANPIAQPAPEPTAHGKAAVARGQVAFSAHVLEAAAGELANIAELGMITAADLAPAFVPGQAGQKVAEEMRGMRRNFQQARADMASKYHAGLMDLFGEQYAMEPAGARVLGQFLPYMALGAIAPASGFWPYVGQQMGIGAGMGAIYGASEADNLGDLLGEMTIGSLVGGGGGMLFGAVPGIKTYIGKKFAEALENGDAPALLALEKRIQQMTNNPKFSFTTADLRADNPFLVGLQKGAGKGESLAKQNENSQILTDYWRRYIGTIDPEDVLTQASGAMVKSVQAKKAAASTAYAMGLDDLATTYGGQITLDGQRYLKALQGLSHELTDPANIGAGGVKRLARHIEFVDKEVFPYAYRKVTVPATQTQEAKTFYEIFDKGTGKVVETRLLEKSAQTRVDDLTRQYGGLDAETTVKILKGHNSVLGGETSVFKNATGDKASVKYLKSELMASLGDSGANPTASAAIKNLQDAYAYEMGMIRALEDEQLAIILGTNPKAARKALQNPEQVMAKLAGMRPTAMRNAHTILQEIAPELISDMKRVVVAHALETAWAGAGGRQQVIKGPDLAKFGKALEGRGMLGQDPTGKLGLNLFDAAEQAQIEDSARAVRTLLNTYTRDIRDDAVGKIADATINIISQSKEFFGRWVARTMGKSATLEYLMIDPAAREQLLYLAKHGPGGPNSRIAIAYLTYAVEAAYQLSADEEKEQAAGQSLEQLQQYPVAR